MTVTAHVLASGPGWSVTDVVCTAGPRDKPFEERHDAVCIAAVTQGSFQYRSTRGSALMSPGALMLGNPGDSYECGHEHASGDRCLAFHFATDHLESIVAAVPGARRGSFAVPRLPPLASLMGLMAAAEAAREDGDVEPFEELALRMAAGVVSLVAESGTRLDRPSPSDERRVTRAVRLIEARASEPLSLGEVAAEAAASPYHFLRVFRQVTGMTPYQFLLRTRLYRAAVRLRASQEPIAAIALDAGFGDLSTFNRRFRRVTGQTPGAYRRGGGGRAQ